MTSQKTAAEETRCVVYLLQFFYKGVKGKRRRGGFMVGVLVSGASGPGSSPGWAHCVVFLGKVLHSHGASFHPGV